MRYIFLIMVCMMVGAPSYAFGRIASNLTQEYQLSSPLQPVDELRLADKSETDNSEDDDEDFITPKQKRKIKGFWEKYFALQLNKNLVKELRENKWAFFAGGCMSCVGGSI